VLSGVHPTGRREQRGGVQRRRLDEGRRPSRVQEPRRRQPVRPQLAQDRPERGGQVRDPVPGLQAHPDRGHRRPGGHRHPGQDGDREEAVRQRADRRESPRDEALDEI